MAPEIFSGGSYGKECDVWSTAVLLFFMLSGNHPFTINDINDSDLAFFDIKNGSFEFPKEDWEDVS